MTGLTIGYFVQGANRRHVHPGRPRLQDSYSSMRAHVVSALAFALCTALRAVAPYDQERPCSGWLEIATGRNGQSNDDAVRSPPYVCAKPCFSRPLSQLCPCRAKTAWITIYRRRGRSQTAANVRGKRTRVTRSELCVTTACLLPPVGLARSTLLLRSAGAVCALIGRTCGGVYHGSHQQGRQPPQVLCRLAGRSPSSVLTNHMRCAAASAAGCLAAQGEG